MRTPRNDAWRGRSASTTLRPHLASSLQMDDSGGRGWLWSPRTGECQDIRAASVDSFRRPAPYADLFDPSVDKASLRSPRGLRRAAEAQRTTTPSASRLKRAETDRVTSRRVRTESREPAGDKETSPRSPEEQRDGSLSPLSSVHRARACSIKGHHYKNRSLASAGLWRDMPTFTPWGCLESLHQPSLSCATARVARTTSRSATPGRQPTSPYAEREPRDAEMSPRTPRPDSARAHYQAAMSGTNPIVGKAWGTDPSETQAGSRPSSCVRASPTSSADGLSRLHSSLTRQLAETSPWHVEAAAVAKSPRSPVESMLSVENGLPAGMITKHGAVAAALDRVALEAAGCAAPMEKLKVGTRLSDTCLRKIEGACGTPRHFAPPSRSRNDTHEKKPVMKWRPKVTNGGVPGLELAGDRRARAACARSGFNGLPKAPPRWQF